MNAKDQAAMDKFTAELKLALAIELKAALDPHVGVITTLQQDLHNLKTRTAAFVTRVNEHNKMYRAEITALRAQVEALTPKAKATTVARISPQAWDAAMAALKLQHPGKTFFAPSEVRGVAATLAAPANEDEEVSL